MTIVVLTGCCRMKIVDRYGNYTVVAGNASGMVYARARHCPGQPLIDFPYYVTVTKMSPSANGVVSAEIVIAHITVDRLTVPFVVTATDRKGRRIAAADTVVLQRVF